MLSKLIEESKLWDKENNLPTIPIHNNPRIYTALVFKFVKAAGEDIPLQWFVDYIHFVHKCIYWIGDVRVTSRWPELRGGNFSHDEILGDSYLLDFSAKQHLSNLQLHFGIFPDSIGKLPGSRWFYRFLFLRPYLKAIVYDKLPWWERAQWALHVRLQVWKTKRDKFDTDGIFKVWLMVEKMIAYCPKTCEAWFAKLESEGITPKLLFKDYLSEVNMADYAPESFRDGLNGNTRSASSVGVDGKSG